MKLSKSTKKRNIFGNYEGPTEQLASDFERNIHSDNENSSPYRRGNTAPNEGRYPFIKPGPNKVSEFIKN